MARVGGWKASPWAWSVARDALLYGWFFLYLLFVVEPHLVYHACNPVFWLTPECIASYTRSAGGPVAAVSEFLAQLQAFDTLGALILTLEAWAIGLLAHAYFAALIGRADASDTPQVDAPDAPEAAAPDAPMVDASDAPMVVLFLRYVPVVLFMLECGQYDQYLTTGPALIATLAAVLLFTRASRAGLPARLALYAVLTVGIYYAVAGASGKRSLVLTLFAFSMLCALFEARGGLRRRGAVAWLAACPALAAAVAYAGERWLLRPNPSEWAVWSQVTRAWSDVLPVANFLFLPLAAFWLVAGGADLPRRAARFLRRARPGRRRAAADAAVAAGAEDSRAHGGRRDAASAHAVAMSPAETGRPAAPPNAKLMWLLQTGALLWVVSYLGVNVTTNPTAKLATQRDYAVVNERWEDVLSVAERTPPEEQDSLFTHDVDTALFFTDRLASDMLAYGPHRAKMLLQMDEPDSWPYLYRLTTMLLRLGRVADAQHVAYEALQIIGDNPNLLKRLALLHIVKGELPAARLFLNTLRGDVVHRGWAGRILELARDEAALADDPEVKRLRAVMLVNDDVREVTKILDGPDVIVVRYPEKELLNLLKRNPANRMAFEYLMGMYLLDNALDYFTRNIGRLDDAGYREIPRLYEEALLVYGDMGGRMPDLHGRRIRPETLARFRAFKEILTRSGNSPERAHPEVAASFRDSYFYHALYGAGAGQ